MVLSHGLAIECVIKHITLGKLPIKLPCDALLYIQKMISRISLIISPPEVNLSVTLVNDKLESPFASENGYIE